MSIGGPESFLFGDDDDGGGGGILESEAEKVPRNARR